VEQVTIASLHPFDLTVYRSYGRGIFTIPACKEGESCSTFKVGNCYDKIDLGNGPGKPTFPFEVKAPDIAKDITQDYGVLGVFICAGDRPTKAEIEAATKVRDEYFERLVFEADRMYEREGTKVEITELHRRAARTLGVERDWIYTQKQAPKTIACPSCDSPISPKAAVCPLCRAILDYKRAEEFGLVEAAAAGPKSNVQRPRS
jgi:hypothetical protein